LNQVTSLFDIQDQCLEMFKIDDNHTIAIILSI
jgi:hypothetical protein